MAIKTNVVTYNSTTNKHEPLGVGDVLAGSVVQLSADAGNSVVLGTDGGLKVSIPAQLPDDQVLSGDNTGSVSVTLTPTVVGDQTNYLIKADTKVDPAVGNIATVSSAGVYVPAPVIPTPTVGTAPTIVDDGTTTTQYFGGNTVALGDPLKWVSTDGGVTVTPAYTASGVSGSTPVVNASKQVEYGTSLGILSDTIITFATPFPSVPFISVTPVSDGSKLSDYFVDSITTTGFVIRRGYLSASGGLIDVQWKAEEK